MHIGVPKERAPGERRVAMTPQVALRLTELRHSVTVEAGAGTAAGMADEQYREAGAEVATDTAAVVAAEVVLRVAPPAAHEVGLLQPGTALIGFLEPFNSPDLVRAMAERRISSFAMEAVPRTTLAQSMDALSSQATAAGYAAVLAGAAASTRFFPMFTTAAGTIPPSKVLILGAGVAGLQAIATARRLGAVVSAYDIRPEVEEQIASLGARFVAAPTDESAAAATGYAKEVTDETQRRQLEALGPHVAASDVVVSTAQIPGRAAPLLISREMVEAMRPGSVIVDVAAPSGGNCEVSRAGETVAHNGVIVLGPTDLPSRVAHDSSQMYARNLSSFLALLDAEGALKIDLDNEIVDGSCITHDGEIVHPVVRRALNMASSS